MLPSGAIETATRHLSLLFILLLVLKPNVIESFRHALRGSKPSKDFNFKISEDSTSQKISGPDSNSNPERQKRVLWFRRHYDMLLMAHTQKKLREEDDMPANSQRFFHVYGKRAAKLSSSVASKVREIKSPMQDNGRFDKKSKK